MLMSRWFLLFPTVVAPEDEIGIEELSRTTCLFQKRYNDKHTLVRGPQRFNQMHVFGNSMKSITFASHSKPEIIWIAKTDDVQEDFAREEMTPIGKDAVR